MTDLLPCPLCGNEAEFIKALPKSGYDRVSCSGCGCEVEDPAAWNTRPAEDALRARVAELDGALRKMVRLAEFRAKCSGSEGYMKNGADIARAALKGDNGND